MSEMSSSLKEAISKIDLLINQLQSGSFVGSSAPIAPKTAPPPQKSHPKAAPTKEKPPKQKQADAAKPAKSKAPANAAAEGPDLFAKAYIAVGRITSCVPHPNSDKLYINQLDIGGGATRQICAGLQKYVTLEEMLNKHNKVCVVLNLKPAKLGGELSEGMILAASEPEGGSGKVKPIVPPEDAQPGDELFLKGHQPSEDRPKALKSDHWRKIAAELSVVDGVACFEGKAIVCSAGKVEAPGFPDKSTIS